MNLADTHHGCCELQQLRRFLIFGTEGVQSLLARFGIRGA